MIKLIYLAIALSEAHEEQMPDMDYCIRQAEVFRRMEPENTYFCCEYDVQCCVVGVDCPEIDRDQGSQK